MTIPLFEKYRPKNFSEVKGQDLAVAKVRAFFSAFSRMMSKKKAILLYGPAGSGKTAIAQALANETDSEFFELNASDLRNRAKLEEVLKPSTLQKSLFLKSKVILVDEVDGVTATDRGGVAELIALIEKTKIPIIITANDVWQQKFSLLRRKCELIPLKEHTYLTVLDVLKNITTKEGKQIDETLLKGIAAKTKGDMRAAINDLQSVIHGEIVSPEHIGERERAIDIFHALKSIFKLKTTPETANTFDNVDIDTDHVVLWLEKNIPKEYQGKELAKAFDAMSRADVFKGRIYRQQHWRFLVYQNFFLSAGVSAAKKQANPDGFTKYDRPTRILKIWMANNKNAKKKTIAAKYAKYTHTSKKRALRDFFLISLTVDDNVAARKLDLSEQEREFLIEYRGALKVAHNLNKFSPDIQN